MQLYRPQRELHAFSKDCATKKLLTAKQNDTTLHFLAREGKIRQVLSDGKNLRSMIWATSSLCSRKTQL